MKKLLPIQLVIPLVALVVLVAAGTILQGTLTDRWGIVRSSELVQFTDALKRVPEVIGEWSSTPVKSDPTELAIAKIDGHVGRSYHNERTGETVQIFLVSGKSQGISTHEPDQCYPANGFAQAGSKDKYTIETDFGPTEFYTTIFQKDDTKGLQFLRIFWAWKTADKTWHAPDYPRFALANEPAIYKLYMIASFSKSQPQTLEESAILSFARDALPVLEKALEISPNGQSKVTTASNGSETTVAK